MTTPSVKMQAALAVPAVRRFLPAAQLAVMMKACGGEEKEFFMQKFIDLAQLIHATPETYAQDGLGDQATAHLHYFFGANDWYITEKDVMGGVQQAFGYAILNGDDQNAEMGYISIQELTRFGVELDLHFTPCTLAEIKAKRAASTAPEIYNPKPWVVVRNPGTDDEDIIEDFATLHEAAKSARRYESYGDKLDVMRRLDDGTLTAEF